MVKKVIFHVIFACFFPKSLDAVAMATEVELNELTLDFLFLHDHYHCQQVSSKSESEREMVPI